MFKRLFVFGLLSLLAIVSCSKEKSKKSILEPEPEVPQYSLIVDLGEGVTGEPTSGTHSLRSGDVVQYSYRATDGYVNAYLVLDSAISALSGTLTIRRNTKIFVRAEKAPVVPQENKPVVETGSKVLTSQDKPLAYAEYISALSKLYEQYSGDEASKRAQAVSQSVFAQASFADIKALQTDLAGKVFDLSTSSVNQVDVRNSESTVGVEIIYINGMFTPEEDAPLAALEIVRLVRGAGLPFSIPVRLFYNASAFRNITEKAFCLVSLGPICLSGLASELTEVTQQFLSVIGVLDARSGEEVNKLISLMKSIRSNNRAVVLIGHSQGTLFAQEALKQFSGDSCVAGISLAGPSNMNSWPIKSPELSGFVVGGVHAKDIILRLGFNNFPRVETTLTRSADQVVANAKFLPEYTKFMEEWRLHSMVGSYLGAQESRELVVKGITDAAKMLSERKICGPMAPPPPPPTGGDKKIYATSSRQGLSFGPSDLWIVSPYSHGADTLVMGLKRDNGAEPTFTDVAESPTGELWGITSENLGWFPYLYLIDKEKRTVERKMDLPLTFPKAAAFNSKGELFIIGDLEKVVGIRFEGAEPKLFWTGNTGKMFTSYGGMDFTPEGELFVVYYDAFSPDRLGKINLETGKITPVGQDPIGVRRVFGLAFFNDGQFFGLTASEDNEGILLSIDPLTGRGSPIRKLSFSAIGATASRKW